MSTVKIKRFRPFLREKGKKKRPPLLLVAAGTILRSNEFLKLAPNIRELTEVIGSMTPNRFPLHYAWVPISTKRVDLPSPRLIWSSPPVGMRFKNSPFKSERHRLPCLDIDPRSALALARRYFLGRRCGGQAMRQKFVVVRCAAERRITGKIASYHVHTRGGARRNASINDDQRRSHRFFRRKMVLCVERLTLALSAHDGNARNLNVPKRPRVWMIVCFFERGRQIT